MPDALIEMRQITKSYRSRDVETRALDAVTLSVQAGDFVAVMGPSGCGKSTLLNIAGLLDRADAGEHRFCGHDVAKLAAADRTRLRKTRIGFIFQNFNLIDELSVRENVELAVLYHGWSRADRQTRVTAVLNDLGIAHRQDHTPQDLSGGQQQRVAIARALVARPHLLLADEPTGNLDSQTGDEVMQLLQRINREGTTVIMVTHSASHAQYADRTVHLLDGRVMAENLRGRTMDFS